MELYDHQVRGVDWLSTKRRAMLLDEQGLGKTITAIRSCPRGATLCVVPSVVLWNWAHEWKLWATRNVQVIDKGSRTLDPDAEVVIVTHGIAAGDKMRKQLVKQRWDTLIIDECQAFKNPKTKRTKAVYGEFNKPSRYALVKHADRVWLMTGTPMPNDVSELWTHIWALEDNRLLDNKGEVLNWERFRRRYCVIRETPWGPKVIANRHIKELKRRMEGLTLRRLKKDELDLPDIRYESIHLRPKALPWEIRRLSDTISDDLAREAQEGLDPNASAEQAYAALRASMDPDEFSRWRRLCGVAKIDPVCELLDLEHESGQLDKCVIFAHHKEVIQAIVDHLGEDNCVQIVGGTPSKERDARVRLFQEDPMIPWAVCNIKAGGVGITLHAADEAVFVELSPTPGDNAQATDRIHRIGQTSHKVRVRFVSLAGTVDEQLTDILKRKLRMIREIMS